MTGYDIATCSSLADNKQLQSEPPPCSHLIHILFPHRPHLLTHTLPFTLSCFPLCTSCLSALCALMLWQSAHVWPSLPHTGALRSSFQDKSISTRQSRGNVRPPSFSSIFVFLGGFPDSSSPDIPALQHSRHLSHPHLNTRPPPLPLFRRSWALSGFLWRCLFTYFAGP